MTYRGREKNKYYLTRGAVFSTLQAAVDYAKDIDTDTESYDEISVCYLDDPSPIGVWIIDSYTEKLGYLTLRDHGRN